MALGVVFLFLPAAALLVTAIGLIAWSGRGLAVAPREGVSRKPWALRMVAGAGTLAGAILCALSPFADIPYAIVALPFLILVATGVWIACWLIPAAAMSK